MVKKLAASLGMIAFISSFAFAGPIAPQSGNQPAPPNGAAAAPGQPSVARSKQHSGKKHHKHHKHHKGSTTTTPTAPK
jgi:hypothetical protein